MTTPTDAVREQEQADAAKTADDAPAPVHPPEERKVLVRDAHGDDPHGGSDGESDLSKPPYDRPEPAAPLPEAKEVRRP
jgi:hypothetical protein